ncbi:unnamed protein product [Paramecium octaurelia]|uniref:Uncharacterized protein n=1 Tax=Paramecium octaurelia TaxID=43137 RepID=A0A8S1VIL5_PAROT|nr:unnamed protein product [Paramecium octaurelia]
MHLNMKRKQEAFGLCLLMIGDDRQSSPKTYTQTTYSQGNMTTFTKLN